MDGEQVPTKTTQCKNVPTLRHITEDLQFQPIAPRRAELGSWCKATCVQLYFLILLTSTLANLSTYKSDADAQKNQIKLSQRFKVNNISTCFFQIIHETLFL